MIKSEKKSKHYNFFKNGTRLFLDVFDTTKFNYSTKLKYSITAAGVGKLRRAVLKRPRILKTAAHEVTFSSERTCFKKLH